MKHEESLEFYDKKFALLNKRDETDTQAALKAAKEQVKEKAIKADIIGRAEDEVVELVEGLLMPITGEYYTLNVSIK